jgi:uncharacterized protein YbjT (DUF2867 family)
MSLPPPTVFVLDASGPIGRAVVAELTGRGARVVAHPRTDSPRSSLLEAAPTHLILTLAGADRHLDLVELALTAAAELERAPRVLYLAPREARLRRAGEAVVRACGLPFTLARSSSMDTGPRAALLSGLSRTARALGARQFARRIRPTDPRELAHGLVHGIFNYTTIGRVLMPEELRYDQANHDQHHVPATRRDGRH